MPKYIIKHGTFVEISDDELMHWKYLKREKVNGKWKYWYDYESLKKDAKSAIDSVTKKATKLVNSGKKSISNYIKKTVKPTVSKISKSVSDVVENVKKRVYKYIAKVPTGDTFRYFYSDEAYAAYKKGKDAVDKALDKNINTTNTDTAKANAKNFVANSLFSSFGEAVYSVVAPAFAALQVELTTPKSFSELKKIDTKQSNDDHQETINPGYDPLIWDYSQNCPFTTAAYDLRKRGYDVEANPISMMEGYTAEDIMSWYKDAQVVSKSTTELYFKSNARSDRDIPDDKAMLKQALESYGDGARGHLFLYWTGGGGHDVIWEVENNEVVIRDCQSNKIVPMEEYLDKSIDYQYMRVDNLECTDDILRTVRNRK